MQAASGKTVITGGTGIAVAPIIVWVLGLFGVEVPAEVAAAIAGLLATAVAYFVPAKSGKYVAGAGQVIADEEEVLTDTSDTNGDSDYPDPGQSYYPDEEDA